MVLVEFLGPTEVVSLVIDDRVIEGNSVVVVNGSVEVGDIVEVVESPSPDSLPTQMELFVYDLIHASKAATRV